jgi:hypothetical protein
LSPDRTHTIARAWTHSHEEDTEGRIVYRSSEYAFPPGRRPRTTLELSPGGGVRYSGGPAPDDRRTAYTGSWTLSDDELRLQLEGRPQEHYQVESADEQRLVLRRTA